MNSLRIFFLKENGNVRFSQLCKLILDSFHKSTFQHGANAESGQLISHKVFFEVSIRVEYKQAYFCSIWNCYWLLFRLKMRHYSDIFRIYLVFTTSETYIYITDIQINIIVIEMI